MKCEKCGTLNKFSYKFCLKCGNSIEVDKNRSKTPPIVLSILVLLMVVLIFAALGFYIFNYYTVDTIFISNFF